jgi:CheY-like chemotaxis protein
MAKQKDLLLVGTGSPPMQLLMTRLRRDGYRVVPVKAPEQAHLMLRVAHAGIGAVVIPMDLPAVDLKEAIHFMRSLAPASELSFLVAGRQPSPEERCRLRAAGVDFALWEPVDPHTLRFQVNRALAGVQVVGGIRTTLRAPADWPVQVVAGGRRKEARVYSISAGGAYLATGRPSPQSSAVELCLPLPSGAAKAGGRVVMTNVPGNLMRNNLPVGMGLRFVGATPEVQAALLVYAQERMRNLEV